MGVLRSGFFSLADETIFWLAAHPEGLLAGLTAAGEAAQIPADQQRQARFAAATLTELRLQKDRLPICELLELALERTGYDAALVNEFLGERKLANLRKLIEQAHSFDRAGFSRFEDFICPTVRVHRASTGRTAGRHAERGHERRPIDEIHQSKGLEFPIVIVADLDRPQNHSSTSTTSTPRWARWSVAEEGDVTAADGYDCRSPARAGKEEPNRLLYVATTRAADY